MGVLACDRRGCDNIMCDYYHNSYGYLCSDCISELQEYLDTGALDVGRFMYSHKKDTYKPDFSLNAYEILTRRD